MLERNIRVFGHDGETKNKILDVATELFAQKGYGTVSMRDIAKNVGIKISSIYYYYASKAALMEDALARFETDYRSYFGWLKQKNARATSLEEMMDNMFNKELLNILNPLGRLGISLSLKEQHNNESARRRVFELFYEFRIQCLKEDFDMLIEQKVIPPSDT